MNKQKQVQRRVLAYKDVPSGSVFRVLKEGGFSAREGLFTKVSNSHSSGPKGDAIFALSDVVRVVSFPKDA